jgi:pimeloyl-ACP methyl ester carboxylesterase
MLNSRRLFIALIAASTTACGTPQRLPKHESPHMKTIEINGVTINYEYKPNSKSGSDTVVLVHGFGASLESWNDIFPGLSAKNSVLRLDLRGHGLSGKPPDSLYSLADQADVVMNLIRKLSLHRVHLIGHSYGGGVVLMTYLANRNENSVDAINIKSLVLIDSAGYRQNFPFFVTAVEKPALQFLANLFPATLRAKVLLHKIMSVKSQITEERIHRYAKYFDLPGASHAIGEAARALIPPDLDDLVGQYKTIAVPTQIIWGKEDPAIPLDFGKRFASDIPNARLSTLANTGHVPHEERPIETLKIIQTFIKFAS